MKTKFQTMVIGTESNRKIVERGKIDSPTHKYITAYFDDLITGTSIKSGGFRIVL